MARGCAMTLRAQVGQEHPDDDALWTVNDIARVLKSSVSWVYKAAERGELPCIRIGAMLRFEPATIRAWLDAKKVSSSLTVGANQSVEVVSALPNREKG
jgi:excisionase family DNA binding protein